MKKRRIIGDRRYTHNDLKGFRLFEDFADCKEHVVFPDLVETGVDILDPVMISNDVSWILENYGAQITVAGGIDNQKIERPDATEQDVIEEVHRAMDAYAHKGRYIPDYIATRAETRDLFSREVEEYGKHIFEGAATLSATAPFLSRESEMNPSTATAGATAPKRWRVAY